MKGAAPKTARRDDWCTPACVLDRVRMMGPIKLDPTGNEHSIVGAEREYRIERGENGLELPWAKDGLNFSNPPYARGQIGSWLHKAWCEFLLGAESIVLVPADTSTHAAKYFESADAVCFWRGRLRFLGAPSAAAFPSVLVYHGARRHLFRHVFSADGWCP